MPGFLDLGPAPMILKVPLRTRLSWKRGLRMRVQYSNQSKEGMGMTLVKVIR